MQLFSNTPIQTRFEESDEKIKSELNKISDDELLSSDLEKIADRIAQQYSIVCDTEFSTEDVKVNSYLTLIPREALRPEQQIGAIRSHYEFAAVDYTFKINGDYTFFLNIPTNNSYQPIEGKVDMEKLTLIVITGYTTLPLSIKWEGRVKDAINNIVTEVKARINTLKKECEKRNANIKPRVLSILENEKKKIISKMKHDTNLNPFK